MDEPAAARVQCTPARRHAHPVVRSLRRRQRSVDRPEQPLVHHPTQERGSDAPSDGRLRMPDDSPFHVERFHVEHHSRSSGVAATGSKATRQNVRTHRPGSSRSLTHRHPSPPSARTDRREGRHVHRSSAHHRRVWLPPHPRAQLEQSEPGAHRRGVVEGSGTGHGSRAGRARPMIPWDRRSPSCDGTPWTQLAALPPELPRVPSAPPPSAIRRSCRAPLLAPLGQERHHRAHEPPAAASVPVGPPPRRLHARFPSRRHGPEPPPGNPRLTGPPACRRAQAGHDPALTVSPHRSSGTPLTATAPTAG